jgi:membrane protease YdiL (CAAX protease family)
MKPRVWPVLVTLLFALVSMLMSGAALGIAAIGIAYARGQHKPDMQALLTQPAVLLGTALLSQLMLFLSVRFVPGVLKDVGEDGLAARVGWKTERLHLGRIVIAWLGTMAVGQIASWLLIPLVTRNDTLTMIGNAARDASLPIFALLVLGGGLAPGLVEELMFRGLTQRRLVERYGPVAGIAFSAFLFGAYHLDLRQGLAAMTMGWWLGWFAMRDGSVVNVALGHALNNTTAFILSRVLTDNDELDHSPMVLISGLFVLSICVALTLRFVKEPAPVS